VKTNSELIGTYGNFVNRGLTFIERKDSTVPEIKGFDELDERMRETIREAPERVGRHIADFRFLDALKEVMAVAHFGNEYFQQKEPWKKENNTTLYLCANLCRTLAIISYPFLPFTAEKIWKMLNLPGQVSQCRWEEAGELAVPEGHRIGKISALYKKSTTPK